uniref:Serpin n=1 Tax=Argas monolakensis TaxID=34602 RepID=Q09JJ6_ARGMO|nr:serpin [Argas monolakensis]
MSSSERTIVATDFVDRAAIDAWAKDASKGLISRAIEGPLDPDTQLILMNAVYFKGFWKKPFSVRSTFKGTFLNHGTEPHLTDIMYMRAEFPVKSLPAIDAQAILLPYQGDDAAMMVVLPGTPTGVDALLQALSVTDLLRSLNTFENISVDLFLPKLEMEGSYMLKQGLRSLGVRRIFEKGHAELSGIGPLLALSDVAHRAKVKVDERGTEAVALTTLPFVTYSSYPTFSAVHPFLFFIVHRSTGTVLFAGKSGPHIAGCVTQNCSAAM